MRCGHFQILSILKAPEWYGLPALAACQPEDLSRGGRLGEVKRRLTRRTCSEAFLCEDLLARAPARAWRVLQKPRYVTVTFNLVPFMDLCMQQTG